MGVWSRGGTGGDDLISKAEDGRWEMGPPKFNVEPENGLRKEEKKTSTQTTRTWGSMLKYHCLDGRNPFQRMILFNPLYDERALSSKEEGPFTGFTYQANLIKGIISGHRFMIECPAQKNIHPKNHGIPESLVMTGDPKQPCQKDNQTPPFWRVQSLILRAVILSRF